MTVPRATKRRRKRLIEAGPLPLQPHTICREFMVYGQNDAASFRRSRIIRMTMPVYRARFIAIHARHLNTASSNRRAAVADGFRLP